MKPRSDLELRDLHDQVQDQLGLFVASCRNRRRRDIERNALLARLEADSQLLLGIYTHTTLQRHSTITVVLYAYL